MAAPYDDLPHLIMLLERLRWVGDRMREAHELGAAPGPDREIWDIRSVRSLVNIHRLNLPADLMDEWGQSLEAGAMAMDAVTVDRETNEAWSNVLLLLRNWATTVRELPETTEWSDQTLRPSAVAGPTVVRFDLLANVVHPTGVALIDSMLSDCIDHCRELLSHDAAGAGFEAAARQHVDQLSNEIDLDAFTASFNLFRSSTRVINDLESTVHRPRGLSMAGFRILFSLWVAGDLQPRQLASLSGVSRAAVSGVLTTLVNAGFVEKTKDATDGRRYTVALTNQGRELVEDNYAAQNAREIELFAPLSQPEVYELGRLLAKLSRRDS